MVVLQVIYHLIQQYWSSQHLKHAQSFRKLQGIESYVHRYLQKLHTTYHILAACQDILHKAINL